MLHSAECYCATFKKGDREDDKLSNARSDSFMHLVVDICAAANPRTEM